MAEINYHQNMLELAQKTKKAGYDLQNLSAEVKNKVLLRISELIEQNKADILAVNGKDVAAAKARGTSSSMVDRLVLNDDRIAGICKALQDIAKLPDQVNKVIWENQPDSGLKIERVTVPLGVIGMIYESRPNVTIDAFALCFKSANAVILRPGSESYFSSKKLLTYVHQALSEHEIDLNVVALVPGPERAYVDEMLKLADYIDVIIPRGGKSLIQKVIEKSNIPIFRHLDGNCHTYINKDADFAKAIKVLLNAKLRRTGICGATESVLIDQEIAQNLLPDLAQELLDKGCEIRGDVAVCALVKEAKLATEEDYQTEYLDKIISIKIVANVKEAVSHINKYGSHHTDAIISENPEAADYFLQNVDSSIVMLNSSTQFADGGEFGLGAEIGISTGKLHARGPVGQEQLMTYKYQVRGNGHVRP